MLKQLRHVGVIAILGWAGLDSATAQTPQPKSYVGEIVMTPTGEVVAPWKEGKACLRKEIECKSAILNATTHEIARVGDKWSTRFEATGNGKEVRRKETELAKASRLVTGARAQPQ